MRKICGIRQKKGSYQGHDYNKFDIYVASNELPENTECYGTMIEIIKIKYNTLYQILGAHKYNSPSQLIDMVVDDVDYDRFGNVKDIVLSK